MGSFRDQYEKNFGKLDPYDPIDVGPFGTPKPRRAALPTSPEEAMAGPTPLYTPDLNLKRTPKESGFLENVGRQFAAGTVQVGEMGLGAAEYVARNNSLLDGIVADTIYSGRSRLAQTREDILAGISEADRQKAAAEILTLDPNRTIWQGNPLDVAEAIIYKTANALPATLVTMIPAIRFARAATPGKAIASMGATEGTMSVGGIQNGIADEILGMTTEELVNESPMFNQILQRNGGNVDEARRELITEAQGLAPLVGGATVAAISSVAGRYFTPIFEKGGGAALGSRVGRGFAAEAPQEGSQGASEQLVQNYAAKIYDLDRQLSEGVAEAAAQEAMIGGTMGSGFAGAFGERPTPERPPGPEIDPNARPEITDQPDLPGFEPGGRLPDELDQPMPEPAMDIDAQIQDLLDPESRREGVYLAPGTDERLVASLAETLPDELTFVRNVDGEGGHMITRSAELGWRAQEAIANGASRQEVIGRITAVGRGKPTNPDSRVVQLLDANGAVARESMVGSQQEAEALGVAWSKEKENKGLRVAVLSPREALERRQILGQEGEFGIQEDMFDNTAARGTDAELVKPAPLEDPIQQQLPLTNQRERGVGRTLEDVDRPTTLPDDILEDGEGAVTDPDEIARRQYGMDFEDPGVETVTTRNKSTRRTGRFLVRMYDDEGNVIHEEAKNSVVGAETTSEALAKDFPDANIQVVPETEADVEVKTRAKKRQAKPIEPEYEQSIEEEVQDDIRANVPFEERDEPLAAVKGSRSYGQAADKLIGASAAEFEAEERGRIGGFYNPDTLEFNEPQYEEEYRAAWDELLNEEIRFEMTGTKTKKRGDLLKKLGEIRQLAKPKRKTAKSEKLLKAARAVNPEAVKEFEKSRTVSQDRPIKEGGPQEPGTPTQPKDVDESVGPLEVMTREEIDALEGRDLDRAFEQAVTFREGREATTRPTPDRSKSTIPTVVYQENGKKQPRITRAFDTEAEAKAFLAELKERGVRRAKFEEREVKGPKPIKEKKVESVKVEKTENRTAALDARKLKITDNVDDEGEYVSDVQESDTGTATAAAPTVNRAEYDTPGKRKKFIRREVEHLRRRVSGQRSVKATEVAANKGKARLKSDVLTQENYPLDESVENRLKREKEAADELASLGKTATKVNLFLNKAGVRKGTGDVARAREFVKQLVKLARSMQATKSRSNQTISQAKKLNELLGKVPSMTPEKFGKELSVVARNNEKLDLDNLRFGSLNEMRIPSKRAEATKDTNNAVTNRNKLREVTKALREDNMYTTMIQPVLRKMSESVISAVESNTGGNVYTPNEADMGELRFALNMNKDKYGEVRAWMKRAGFQFDENNNLTGYEARGEYLEVQAKSKRGKELPPPPTAANIDEQLTRGTRRKEAQAKEERTDQRRAAETYDKVNGLIERFRKATASSKTTISGIKRQEARFIRGLKKLGVWRDTGPNTGVINIGGFSTKTYVKVSDRVGRGKALDKAAAREHIQKIKAFPIPRSLQPFVRQVRTPAFEAGVERFLDENAIELFIEAAQPINYDAEYTSVAEAVGDMLMDGIARGTDVLNAILELAPQNSFYRNLADRLRGYDLSNVKVVYGTDEDFPRGQPGKFQRGSNTIFINRDALRMGDLSSDEVAGARVVHTLTHELIHAVTHQNIDSNASLRRYMEGLQRRAREMWQQRIGSPLPYGLKVLAKSQNEVHEFIAEAFSNHEFQNFLKDTPREPQSIQDLWQAFVNAVRGILGLPARAPSNNLFDAILLSEDILFDDAGFGGDVGAGDLFIAGDAALDPIASAVSDALGKVKGSNFWSQTKDKALNLMTFTQLENAYARFFPDGAFTKYMSAWRQRNAAVSKHMKLPEALSVRWTKLESDPETSADAVEISKIATKATLYRMTPSKSLTAKERAEVAEERLQVYDELRARFLALSPTAQKLYEDVRDWYKQAGKDEADLLLSSTLRGVLTQGPGAKLSTDEFKSQFPMERIRELNDDDAIKAALKDYVPEDEIDGLVKELKRMASVRNIGFGDYFPLMRYGEYVVYAESVRSAGVFADSQAAHAKRKELLSEDPTLEVGVIPKGESFEVRVTDKEFWMFENKSEASKKRFELEGKFQTVSPVQARISRDTEEMAISSNAALKSILTSLSGNPAAQAAVKNHYIRSLSDSAFRKHELKRKNTKGVDDTVQHRNFANYMKQSAYYRAQLEFGWQMGENLRNMADYTRGRADTPDMATERLQQVVKQVQYRDQLGNDPQELRNIVRKGVNVTQFWMLTSPSYWMINASQPWMVTLPIMGGKHGIGNTLAAMKHAQGLIKSPLFKEGAWNKAGLGLKAFKRRYKGDIEDAFNVVDQLIETLQGTERGEQYGELINYLRDRNIIDINVLTELRQIAEGVQNDWTTNALDAGRILAHITEVNNRVVTALAAYDLEINAGSTKEEAFDYARQMVSQTQFDYSSENKPPLFQPGGPLKWAAPLMFQFMQWPQHMYALLITNFRAAYSSPHLSAEERAAAKKGLFGLLTTHAAVGGATGMMLQPVKWALGLAMMAFGDEDEPYTFANAMSGETYDNLVQEAATGVFGNTIGRAVGSGLPTLAGFDLSSRMSMGNVYFVDVRGDSPESVIGSLAMSFGGATVNQGISFGRAVGKFMDGDYYRAVEQASPKIFRDVLRAGRYYNEGLVNNAGDTVIDTKDFSAWETFLQGIGFAPDEVSKYYQGQAAIKGAQGYARDRRERLIRQFVEDGSSSEVLKEVREFNRAYPSMRITRSTLIRGARAQVEREQRYGRYGANIDDKEARDFRRYGDPYR